MKNFFKSFLLLVTAGLFAATGWTAGESISIKFNGGDLAEGTDYGCYPVAGSDWFKTTEGSASGTLALNETGALATELIWSAPTTYDASRFTTTANALFSTFLDDNSAIADKNIEIRVTGLDTTVFANYDVLIYLSGDSTSPFRALTVNETTYTGGGEGGSAVQGTDFWGVCSSTTLVEPRIGVNTLYIKGLTATDDANTLSISVNAVAQNDRANGRACIAALQILPTGLLDGVDNPTLISQFEGNANVAGWFDDWTSEKPQTYVKTPKGRGFIVETGKHPYNDNNNVSKGSNPYSVALYADISIAPKNTVLFSLGTKDIALVKIDADTIQLRRSGNLIEGLTIDDSDLATCGSFHLIAFGSDENGSFLTVDDTTVTSSTDVNFSKAGVQLGSLLGGASGTTYSGPALGMVVDEVRGYDVKLDESKLKILASIFEEFKTYKTYKYVVASNSWENNLEPSSYDSFVVVDFTETTNQTITLANILTTVSEVASVAILGEGTVTGNGITIGGVTLSRGATLSVNTSAAVNRCVGEGTLEYVACLPTCSGLTNAETWKGTLKIKNLTGTSNNLKLNQYGNANSIVELDNVLGYIEPMTIEHLRLSNSAVTDGFGFQQNNGSSGTAKKITINKLSGNGNWRGPTGTKTWMYDFIVKDAFDFNGSIDFTSGGMGSEYAVIFGEEPAGFAHNDYKKHLTINGLVKIANGQTWKPATGSSGIVKVTSQGILSGAGSIASNLTFAENATIDTSAGAVTVTGTVELPTLLTVKVSDVQAWGQSEIPLLKYDVTNVDLTQTTFTIKLGETILSGMTVKKSGNSALVLENSGIVSIDVETSSSLSQVLEALGEDQLPENTKLVLDFGDTTSTFLFDRPASVFSIVVKGSGSIQNTSNGSVTLNRLSIASGEVDVGGVLLPSKVLYIAKDAKLTVSNTAEWQLNRIYGGGTLIKQGEGILKLQVPNATDTLVAENVKLDICEGQLCTWLNGNDNNPKMIDVSIAFAEDVTWTSHGWLNIEGILTLSSTAEEGTTFAMANGSNPAIAGSGKVYVKSGKITLLNGGNASYSGGTEIAKDATLTITNTNALGTGAITGKGTLECTGVLPANTNGLTNSTTWTGTVKLLSGNSYVNVNLANYQNSNSIIEIEGVTCYLSCYSGGETKIYNLCLTGEGLQFDNGTSNGYGTLTITNLSGTGKFKGVSGSANFGYKLKIRNATDFKGEIDLSAERSQRASVTFGDATPVDGKITIAAPVTINQDKIWKAREGVTVTGTGTISGTGKLSIPLGKALDYSSSATSTFAGIIEGDGGLNVGNTGTLTLSTSNTYTGGTEIAKGATVNVEEFNRLGSGEIVVDGTLEFAYNSGYEVPSTYNNLLKGSGSLKMSPKDDNAYVCFLNGFTTTLDLITKSSGTILVGKAPDTVITFGSLSGDGGFRCDWGTTGPRTITIVQDSNTSYSGAINSHNGADNGEEKNERTLNLRVQAKEGAEDKTFTFSGSTNTEFDNVLTVDSDASVCLDKKWENSVFVSGTLSCKNTGSIGKTLTLADGATIDATNGAVTVTGGVTTPEEPGKVTVKATNYGDVLVKGGLDASKFALEDETYGELLATNAALVYTPKNPGGASDEAMVAIAQLAGETQISSITGNPDAVIVFSDVTPSIDDGAMTIASPAFGVQTIGIHSVKVSEVEKTDANGNTITDVNGDPVMENVYDHHVKVTAKINGAALADGATVKLYLDVNGSAMPISTSNPEIDNTRQTITLTTTPTLDNLLALLEDENVASVEEGGSEEGEQSGESGSATPPPPTSKTLQFTIKAVKTPPQAQ